VLNCTGAHSPLFLRVTPQKFVNEVNTGIDVCLYCAAKLEKPPLLSSVIALPLQGGVMVCAHLPGEKEFTSAHKERILSAVGIRPETVCNITTALRVKAKSAILGRWKYTQGILHLLPGLSLCAFDTAYEGIGAVFDLSNVKQDIAPLYGRPLPGGWKFEENSKTLPRTRYGSLFRLVSEDTSAGESVAPGVLKGEIKIAIQLEQARTAEDVISRRLGLRIMPEEFSALRAAVDEFMRAPLL